MKSKKILLILRIIILSMICIIGCENDKDKPNMDFVYPLTVGNSWEYEKLYKKYELSQEEIEYIESKIRAME